MVESLLGVDPTQSYGENTKKRIQDFIEGGGGGRLFKLWASLSSSILLLAHPALSHSLNILFIIFEKMNARGVGRIGRH